MGLNPKDLNLPDMGIGKLKENVLIFEMLQFSLFKFYVYNRQLIRFFHTFCTFCGWICLVSLFSKEYDLFLLFFYLLRLNDLLDDIDFERLEDALFFDAEEDCSYSSDELEDDDSVGVNDIDTDCS